MNREEYELQKDQYYKDQNIKIEKYIREKTRSWSQEEFIQFVIEYEKEHGYYLPFDPLNILWEEVKKNDCTTNI